MFPGVFPISDEALSTYQPFFIDLENGEKFFFDGNVELVFRMKEEIGYSANITRKYELDGTIEQDLGFDLHILY